MAEGERIQRMIYAWLDRATKIPWGVIDPPSVDISEAPIEIKMLCAFDTIEYNISNGGWAQFLWNCFDDWRGLIEVAREGYRLIGATEQCAALDQLQAVCAEHERECDALQSRAETERDLDNRYFAKFTAGRFYEWERQFSQDAELDAAAGDTQADDDAGEHAAWRAA